MYAVGDTVKVRNDLIPETLYNGVTFVSSMVPYYNVITKIQSVIVSLRGPLYQLEGCDGWRFTDAMLEPVAYTTQTPAKFKVGDKIMVIEKAVTTDKLVGLSYSFFSRFVGCTGEIVGDCDEGKFSCDLRKNNGDYIGHLVIHQDNLVLLSDNSTQPITPQSESKTTTLKLFEPTKTSTISITEVEVECCRKETYTI